MVDVRPLIDNIEQRRATVGVIGLGYVGLPLVLAFLEAGFRVLGFDVDPAKPAKLHRGESYLKHLSVDALPAAIEAGRFEATTDFARLGEADAVLICVPTPLTRHREPDLSYVTATAEAVLATLRPGQLVVLESTTYPGTTAEVLKPVLERGGLKSGRDFLLAFSPEREDPGNPSFHTHTIPKVVGGDGPDALAVAQALYDRVIETTVPVSSMETAEAVKLTENIFRAVNIALVNELKMIYGQMGIDVWEVIDAAKTKPFGFMPFYPGPGLGGHCIPIDPFYLSWKAREYGQQTRFIELAGEVNVAMPGHVVETLARALSDHRRQSVNGARILVIGVSYKKNVDDMRESPSLVLMEMLEARGAAVDYFDPHVPEIPSLREHASLTGRRSVAWDPATLETFDAVLIATDHDAVDYAALVRHAPLVVDTRNATRDITEGRDKIVKA